MQTLYSHIVQLALFFMSKHINLLSVKRAMSSKQLLPGPHQCSAAGSFLVCRSLRSVSCDHFLISTTLFHINSTDFLFHKKLKSDSGSLSFQDICCCLQNQKTRKKNVWSSKGKKKRAAFPPVSWGLGWCVLGYLLGFCGATTFQVGILWRHNFSSQNVVAPQNF